MLPTGRRLGAYELIERIGAGGMAEVFIAKTSGAVGFERLVALKRILPDMIEDEQFVTMLVDEASLVAKLNHPGIAQVYDLGRTGDEVYLAMEYVAGRDLRSIIRALRTAERTFEPRLACHIVASVLDALGHAHAAKDGAGQSLHLVHRDVSPSNIMISYEGDVKLIDFGIATAKDRKTTTESGVIKGKVRYMSPEQVDGRALDGRSDIYAAGVVLYELLAGRRLFEDTSDVSLLHKITHGDLEPLVKVNPQLPGALGDLVGRALQKGPAERFARAEDFASALQQFAIGGHSDVRPREALHALMIELYGQAIEADRLLRLSLAQPSVARLNAPSPKSATVAAARVAHPPPHPIDIDTSEIRVDRDATGRVVRRIEAVGSRAWNSGGDVPADTRVERPLPREAPERTQFVVPERPPGMPHWPVWGALALVVGLLGFGVYASSDLAGALSRQASSEDLADAVPAALPSPLPIPLPVPLPVAIPEPLPKPVPAPPEPTVTPDVVKAAPAAASPRPHVKVWTSGEATAAPVVEPDTLPASRGISAPLPVTAVPPVVIDPKTGLIGITSWPAGYVLIDSVNVHLRTPVTALRLPVGLHEVRVVSDDGRVGTAAVTIAEGLTSAVYVQYP